MPPGRGSWFLAAHSIEDPSGSHNHSVAPLSSPLHHIRPIWPTWTNACLLTSSSCDSRASALDELPAQHERVLHRTPVIPPPPPHHLEPARRVQRASPRVRLPDLQVDGGHRMGSGGGEQLVDERR